MAKMTTKTVEKMTFKTKVEMMAYIKALTAAQHTEIVAAYDIGADSPEHAKTLASYIIQGVFLKKSGNDLVEYALSQAEKIGKTMPSAAVKVATEKVAKVKKEKPASKPRIKYADFEIVERPDRGGWEGWYAGKAEAFRTTVAKVDAFFLKKYKATGTVVPARTA